MQTRKKINLTHQCYVSKGIKMIDILITIKY